MVDRSATSSMGYSEPPAHPQRRRFLWFLASSFGLLTLTACNRTSDATTVDVALDSIPPQGRLRVMLGDEPVELQRDGQDVIARSLWCTHMGCELQWDTETRHYECPCHEGRFAPDGRVVGGPPLEPMRRLDAQVESGRVIVSAE